MVPSGAPLNRGAAAWPHQGCAAGAAAVRALLQSPPRGVAVQLVSSRAGGPPRLGGTSGGGGSSGGAAGPAVGVADADTRFVLDVTVDGVPARWELFFAGPQSLAPPDVVFVSDPSFALAARALPSLERWPPSGSAGSAGADALAALVSEIAAAYRVHLQRLASEHPSDHIRRVHARVIGDAAVREARDVTCSVLPFPPGSPERDSCRPVRFTFRFKRLTDGVAKSAVAALVAKNPPMLRVDVVPKSEHQSGSKVEAKPTLLLVKEVASVLGVVKAPPFRNGVDLSQYVQECESMLVDRLRAHGASLSARRAYIAALLSHFGSALLEYDVEKFTSVSFLFEVDGFFATVLVRFVEGAAFPETMPTVTLMSPCTLRGGSPASVTHTAYPYSPRWTPDDMAVRLRAFLTDAIPKFKREQHV